jgi:hypothetical protein
MAFYLVRARPVDGQVDELMEKLKREEFKSLDPFGKTLHRSLLHARREADERAVWEEDYCSPPLAQEREAALEHYFPGLEVEPVSEGKRLGTD